MKRFLIICMLLVSCQVASAQQDLYQWQLSGYTGIANYINDDISSSDYFKINDNLFHRLELTRSLGSTFGLSVGYSMGEVRGHRQQLNAFTTDVRMAAARAYFYTDNGWLLRRSAWVSPYLFGGYGLGILETAAGSETAESRYVSAIPFGLGLKFRVAERWQLALQTEAVYLPESHLQDAALRQNKYNNAFLHTGIRVGYSFGFKKSTFKAARFYAGETGTLQTLEGYRPRQNVLEMMLQLEPREVRINTEPAAAPDAPPVLTQREIISPDDTLAPVRPTLEADTSSSLAQIKQNRLVPAEPVPTPDTTTTSDLQTISSAGTIIRMDSVVDNTTIRPVPVAREREALAEEAAAQTQTIVETQQRVQTPDSIITTTTITTTKRVPVTTREAAPARAARTSPVRTRDEAPARTEQAAPVIREEAAPVRTEQRAPVRTQEAAPVGSRQIDRVVERNVYVPSETRSIPVRSADAAQLQEERLRLTTVNAQNRKLQSRLDSLQAAPATTSGDTLPTAAPAAVDTTMLQYLQQQAALNDSMLQRLNQYEKELALLKSAPAAPAPVAAPTEAAPVVAPRGYTTAVFYPINAHRVPSESLRDLNQVLKTLQENPGMRVKLTGHTSQSGNAAYNLVLSRKRVQSLVDFLTDQGIAEARISTEYLGDEKSSQKENPLDRKVEVQIFE